VHKSWWLIYSQVWVCFPIESFHTSGKSTFYWTHLLSVVNFLCWRPDSVENSKTWISSATDCGMNSLGHRSSTATQSTIEILTIFISKLFTPYIWNQYFHLIYQLYDNTVTLLRHVSAFQYHLREYMPSLQPFVVKRIWKWHCHAWKCRNEVTVMPYFVKCLCSTNR